MRTGPWCVRAGRFVGGSLLFTCAQYCRRRVAACGCRHVTRQTQIHWPHLCPRDECVNGQGCAAGGCDGCEHGTFHATCCHVRFLNGTAVRVARRRRPSGSADRAMVHRAGSVGAAHCFEATGLHAACAPAGPAGLTRRCASWRCTCRATTPPLSSVFRRAHAFSVSAVQWLRRALPLLPAEPTAASLHSALHDGRMRAGGHNGARVDAAGTAAGGPRSLQRA